VYLNRWLQDEGYLQFENTPPKSHQDIAATTRAFNMDPARIYIHRQGTFAKGAVAAGDAEALIAEIAAKLRGLTIDGRPVIDKIFRKQDLYRGYYLPQAPDLVLLPHRGFDLKGTISQAGVAGRSQLTGMHTQDDAVIFVNRKITKPTKVDIVDLAPTMLQHLGLVLPPELDGVPLT
jgi:predicted AlkP superfamily phosphohydrolase/phosphomutase